MRTRIPVTDPQKSLADTLEYALTTALVIVVIAAICEICGAHFSWLG